MRHYYSTPAYLIRGSTNSVTAIQAWPTEDSIIPSGSPESRFLPVAPRTPSPTFEPFIDADNVQPTDKGKGNEQDTA
jgi:hypothetical protein